MSDDSRLVFKVIDGPDVDDEQMKLSAQLFSDHYGIWSKEFKPNARVRTTPKRLRQECLSHPDRSILAICTVDGVLVGQAFATTWNVEEDVVGWITQLVVHKEYRRRGIATCLLRHLREHTLFSSVNTVGVASTHPATCSAVAGLAGVPVENANLEFVKEHASAILASSSVTYLRTAKPKGILFGDHEESVISTVDTDFPVDHEEPEKALRSYRDQGRWILGSLPERHEFLLIVRVA